MTRGRHQNYGDGYIQAIRKISQHQVVVYQKNKQDRGILG